MTHALQRGGVVPRLDQPIRFELARRETGATQREFAEMIGASVNTVQRAEQGIAAPQRRTLLAWAMATGVDLHWLETGHAPGTGACRECAIRDLNPEPADSFSAQVIDLFSGRVTA